MLRFIIGCLGVFLSLSALSVNAELIKGDAFESGDFNAVLDTNTGLEWLDLDVTDLTTDTESERHIDNIEQAYPGFRPATVAEIESMMSILFPDAFLLGKGRVDWVDLTDRDKQGYQNFSDAFDTSSRSSGAFFSGVVDSNGQWDGYGIKTGDGGGVYLGRYAGENSGQLIERYNALWMVSKDDFKTYSYLNDDEYRELKDEALKDVPVASMALVSFGGLLLVGLRRSRKCF